MAVESGIADCAIRAKVGRVSGDRKGAECERVALPKLTGYRLEQWFEKWSLRQEKKRWAATSTL